MRFVLIPGFKENWAAGFRFLCVTAFAIGFAALAGITFAGFLFGFLVVLPAEIFYHNDALEDYFPHVMAIGCVTIGIYSLGQMRESILQALRPE